MIHVSGESIGNWYQVTVESMTPIDDMEAVVAAQ